MTKRQETKKEERKRKQQEQHNDRANTYPIWRNVTEQMRQKSVPSRRTGNP